MNTKSKALAMVVSVGAMVAGLVNPAPAVAAISDAEEPGLRARKEPVRRDPPVVEQRGGEQRGWELRADAGAIELRDGSFVPGLERGLTVGRRIGPWFTFEAAAAFRTSGDSGGLSVMALARGALVSLFDDQHQLTVAAGPLTVFDNDVHGDTTFLHTELAYIYRAKFGLVAMVAAGPNIALHDTPYQVPARPASTGGDNLFPIPSLPGAKEIHAGDRLAHVRVAVGWAF